MAVPVGVVEVLVSDLRDGQVSAVRAWTVSLVLVGGRGVRLAVAGRTNVVLWTSNHLAGRDLRAWLLNHVRRLPVRFPGSLQRSETPRVILVQ